MTGVPDGAGRAVPPAGISSDGIDGSFVPVSKRSVISTEVDGETVLVDIATSQVHLLDPIGTAVWACFDGSASIQELVADLAEVFSADTDEVYGDVINFARRLGRQGLLEGVLPADH